METKKFNGLIDNVSNGSISDSLSISCEELTTRQVEILVEALKQNKMLYALYFENSYIGNEGIKVLSEALKENKILRCMYLENGKCRPVRTRAVAEAIAENRIRPFFTS